MQPNQAARIEMALRSLGFEARVQGRPRSKDVEIMVRDLERLAGIAPLGETHLPADRYARPEEPENVHHGWLPRAESGSASGPGTGIDGTPLRWKDDDRGTTRDTVLYGPNDVGGVPTDD